MVPAPVPAVFSLFRQLVNHLRGEVKSFGRAGPIDVLHLHSGRVSKLSRVMVPGGEEADSLAPSGWFFQVPSGSLLGKARLSIELSLRPPVLSGNSYRRHPPFEKAANPKQAGKGSVGEPREESPRSTSLFFMGCCTWLALSGVTEPLKV